MGFVSGTIVPQGSSEKCLCAFCLLVFLAPKCQRPIVPCSFLERLCQFPLQLEDQRLGQRIEALTDVVRMQVAERANSDSFTCQTGTFSPGQSNHIDLTHRLVCLWENMTCTSVSEDQMQVSMLKTSRKVDNSGHFLVTK